jgi:hypothetical protein
MKRQRIIQDFDDALNTISRESNNRYFAALKHWDNHIKNGNTGGNKKVLAAMGQSL